MRNYLEISERSSVAFCVSGGGAVKQNGASSVVVAVPDVGICSAAVCVWSAVAAKGIDSVLTGPARSSGRAGGAHALSRSVRLSSASACPSNCGKLSEMAYQGLLHSTKM